MIAVFNAETVAQLTANGLFRGAAYGLLGVGFAIILGVTGRFHFAYSFVYALSAYMVFTFTVRWNVPFWVAMALGILFGGVVGVVIERGFYRPLAKRAGANALLAIFVASLGLGIAGENMIRWFWSSSSQNLVWHQSTYQIWKVRFLNYDVYQSLSGLAFVLVLTALLRFTPLGRAIKATRVNPDLAQIIGINTNTIYLVCFFIGSLACGLAAFWYGLQFTVAPDMGQRPVIFAFVVAFLAGTARSPIRVFFTGVAVALIEQWSSIWLDTRWTQLAVFVILVGYLTSLSLPGRESFARFIRRLRPAA
jgi:branched-subunit amino acid ABC-type transport system permease component